MGRAPREGRRSVGGAGRDGRSREILLWQCPAAVGETGSRGALGSLFDRVCWISFGSYKFSLVSLSHEGDSRAPNHAA
jgi:hypothetical protein